MPIDFEMLLSATHPLFESFSLSTFDSSEYDRSYSFPRSYCVPRPCPKNHGKKPVYDAFFNKVSYDTTSRREHAYRCPKKKVSFADDRGLSLVEVREIPGAPKWADDVLTHLVGNSKRSVVKDKSWKLASESPPWSDEALVQNLENNMIVVEHVAVKEETDTLYGSVKVKNFAYEKDVFIRVTFDRWLSYVDVPCSYFCAIINNGKRNEYDTFTFETKILPAASKFEVIEFCACYKCNDSEYWDNNGGINYRLIVEYSKDDEVVAPPVSFRNPVKCKTPPLSSSIAWNNYINHW